MKGGWLVCVALFAVISRDTLLLAFLGGQATARETAAEPVADTAI
jgi:hypothetical protein